MTQNLGVYVYEEAHEIRRRVLGERHGQPPLDNTRDKTIHNLLYYAVLTENLDAADNELTGYASADCRILRYVQPINPNSLDMEQSTTPAGLITVTNRYTSFSAKSGDLLMIIRHGSEWAPVTVVASTSRHARITGCLGNGYYSATLSDNPSFSLPSITGTGTATGTGSGQYNECSPCQWITGENTGTDTAVCGSIQQPSRVSVPADGQTIYCYDPRKLTLATDAHVILTNLGDQVVNPETGTGTGTGTAIDYIPLWMVLTGNYELVGIPDRFYECCNNEVIMTRCDTYIVEGFYCPGVDADCPGTGT